MRGVLGWETLSFDAAEALDMIQHKIARILNGDPNYIDSWTDIIGYARLVEKRLTSDQMSEPEPCTDPRCPEHNASIRDALEVLIKAGVVSAVK